MTFKTKYIYLDGSKGYVRKKERNIKNKGRREEERKEGEKKGEEERGWERSQQVLREGPSEGHCVLWVFQGGRDE